MGFGLNVYEINGDRNSQAHKINSGVFVTRDVIAKIFRVVHLLMQIPQWLKLTTHVKHLSKFLIC